MVSIDEDDPVLWQEATHGKTPMRKVTQDRSLFTFILFSSTQREF
jgi:hypothetical protein